MRADMPMQRVPDCGCVCHMNGPCICGPNEKALRTIEDQNLTMDVLQREWCLDEIRKVEGWDDYEDPLDDSKLAMDVLCAWYEEQG